MKKPFVALLLLLGAAAMLASSAFAQDDLQTGIKLPNGKMAKDLLSSRAHRLSTSAGPDPDTVYVGKSFANHTSPTNYWNIYVGDYLPGLNRTTNAFWDWDNSVGIQAPDSLHGWWPIRRQYANGGGLTLSDQLRPFWCLDHGNQGNYVISQQSSAKRTFGVVSYWHRDPGNGSGSAMMWSPISGTGSAWCGLRQHGDNSVVDQVTNNPYNQDAVQYLNNSLATFGTSQRFPGYVDQSDQFLYRDIRMNPTQSLTVTFNYRTRMSTGLNTATATRTGWFHGDPLAVAPGNFISSTDAGAAAPIDSFMVYVGAPVNDASCVYSDGQTRPVYDKQRRWFSEVVKAFGPGSNYVEIFSKFGANPTDTLSATPSSGPIVVPALTISNILGGSPGNVRLVFRVKTNRGFADSDSRASLFNSAGRGAVILDDIQMDRGGGAVTIGNFEQAEQSGLANSIDNRFPLPPSVPDTTVWRTSGKPISPYFHVEALSNLTFNDLCGPVSSPGRLCNLGGIVVTLGNHDDAENAGDTRFASLREVSQAIVSPTIDLIPAGGGAANEQGISATIASASDDYVLWYDIYTGLFNPNFTGEFWWFGAQCYPGIMPNGGKCWAGLAQPPFRVFNSEPQCLPDFEPFLGNGTPFVTSNAGLPDSLRLYFVHEQSCFEFSVSLLCNSNDGGYFDNVSLAFIDLEGIPGQASASNGISLGAVSIDGAMWPLVNDTFPANETPGLPGTAAFDTTGALLRDGINIAQATGNESRFDIPGDSMYVVGNNAALVQPATPTDSTLRFVRVDLVFRILPGPGNYQIAGGRNMAPGASFVNTGLLLQVPQNQAALVTAGDASFWGQYIADPGLVSKGVHGPGAKWDPTTWNSARCDTAERPTFPIGGSNPVTNGLVAGRYMSMYHELDPKFATLGVNKFRCFVVDTTKAATSIVGNENVQCNGTAPTWLLTVPQSRTGWDGTVVTKESSPIIPDGLLTPGSHVQYFFRKSHDVSPFLRFTITPDTTAITPQVREGSTDQARFEHFAVLPDRWKNGAFGGAGNACMLYVDLNDRRGNEGRFVATMDSIGATAVAKRGAHNGWFADGNTSIVTPDWSYNINPSIAVSNKNSQPGTTWDMYQVKASESITTTAGGLGSRLANRATMGFADLKYSRQGPTPEMLRAYYRVVSILTGDLVTGVMGPFNNRSTNDIALLSDYLQTAGGLAQPRGIFIQGDGFGQSEKETGDGVDVAHLAFLSNMLGVNFRASSYQALAGNLNDCADIITTTNLTQTNDIYGVANTCLFSNDTYTRNPAFPEAVEGAFYENVGLNGPYVSDVVKKTSGARPWIAVTSGYEIEHLFSRYCDTDNGRLAYYYFMLNQVFGGICPIAGPASATLETPQAGRAYTNFMKIGNSVMRQGPTVVRFGVAKQGRVQITIFDVTGRKIRNLADRVFPAGEHSLQWDGTDDVGSKVARGVYFVRSSVQKDAGRIIVLNN